MTASPDGTISPASLAQRFDHTLLKPEATEVQIRRLCDEALQENFYAVCINPYWVPLCTQVLTSSSVAVCAVVGFPLGASRSLIKAGEADLAVRDGAAEIDMVLNIGQLMAGNRDAVAADIRAVREAVPRAVLKVIIESALLPPPLRGEAAAIVRDAGADYVKTSTGFHAAGGATVEDVALLRSVAGDRLKVKASGGIRDLATTLKMIEAGADRIGASAGMAVSAAQARRPKRPVFNDMLCSLLGGRFLAFSRAFSGRPGSPPGLPSG